MGGGGAAGAVAGVDPDGDGAIGGEGRGARVLHQHLQPVQADVVDGQRPRHEHLPAVGVHVETARVVPGGDDELDLTVQPAVRVLRLDHGHGPRDVVVHGHMQMQLGSVGVGDQRAVVVLVQDRHLHLRRVVERGVAPVHGHHRKVVVGHRLVVQRARQHDGAVGHDGEGRP